VGLFSGPLVALLYATPIGVLGGLIGLGGAAFRLPVLAGPLGYPVRQAVALNLAVSLVTLAVSLAIRSSTLTLATVAAFTAEIASLIAGAVVAAFFGAGWAARLSEHHLRRVMLALLVAIGLALIIESVLPGEVAAIVPASLPWRVATGILFGLAIGLVSSLLGVAGGELIIPTLVFAFGADIKTAGTASLLVSLPTVVVGLVRYTSCGAFRERQPLTETVAPMAIGSIVGAVVGGLLVGTIPPQLLKLALGIILLISAWRTFRHQ